MSDCNRPYNWVPDCCEEFAHCCKEYDDIIIRGGTCEHIFIIPLALDNRDSLTVTYLQGITKVITRVPNSATVNDDDTTTVRIVLSETETLKFKAIDNEYAKAQISIVFYSNDTKSFSDVKKFKVINTLENI